MTFLKNRKFTLLHLLIFSLVVALITFSLTDYWQSKNNTPNEIASTGPSVCKIDVKRLQGLKYISPIMFAEEECESDDLADLKHSISEIINRYKANQDINTASVYIKNYKNSDWTCLNEEEKYQPGSLFKVPVLITILKMNEDNPGFLDKVIRYEREAIQEKQVAYTSKSIQLGQSYSVRQLLTYMIKYSDNRATILLESNMNPNVYQRVFADLGLTVPKLTDKEYFITVREYSFFMRAIYNAAYLTIKDSEFAAELLTECDFKEGMVKGIPSNIPIAHKFGESGSPEEKQLHESGIIYLNGNPFLLTIMIKGKENQKMAQMITEITQTAYLNMNSERSVM